MEKTNKSPSYLKRVGTKYHFRFRFPKKYCNYLSGEIFLSLKTGDLFRARGLASMLANETRKFIKGEGACMSTTKQEIKAALGAYLRANLELIEDDRLKNIDPYQTDIKGIDLGTFKETKVTPKNILKAESTALKDELSGNEDYNQLDGGKSMTESVDNFLEGSGFPAIKKDDLLYKFVHRELLKVEQAVNVIEQERSQGSYNTPTELSILTAYPDPEDLHYPLPIEKKVSIPISEVVKQYIDENISDGKWKKSTLKEYRNHLKLFVEVTGDCPLSEMDHPTTRSFFDKLKKIPVNRKKVKAYRDRSLAELFEMSIPKGKLISDKTVNNYMTSLSAFYGWCVTREYLPKDYTRKMRVKIDTKESDLKDPFTEAELKIIFDDLKPYQDNKAKVHRWWIPFIGLYTGARLEEIAHLYTEDIKKNEKGVWCFDINENAGTKSIKGKHSRRLTPIHESIVKAGFLDYYKKVRTEGHKHLFPDLKNLEGKYGHYITRWFGTYLTKMKIKTLKHNVSFHSLRHSFITKAKHLDLPESYIKQYVGHSIGSITYGRYGKGYSVTKLKEIVDKVVFPL